MPVTSTNLIMGVGELYTGAFGATEPSTVTTAPDSAVWTNVGGTTDGVTINVSLDFATIEVDQTLDIPERRLTKRELTFETNLAEVTLENLAAALNSPAPTTASNTKTFTPNFGASASQPIYRSILFDGYAPGGKRRRVIARKCLSTEGIETAYTKEDVTVFSVTFTAHYVSSAVPAWVFMDDVTSA